MAMFCFMKKILKTQKDKNGIDTTEKLVPFLGVKQENFDECLQIAPLLYELTPIPKKDTGYRMLSIPKIELRDIQRSILDKIFSGIRVPICVYGFSKGKSIVENAKYHSMSNYLLNLDIKSFFPSVHFERIKQIYRDLGFNEDVSDVLCKLTTYKYQLPQGAPTSPLIATLALNNLDCRLIKLAETNHVLYSRYFDDISFSGSKRVVALEKTIVKIIESEKYKINSKRNLYKKGDVKEINGILITDGKLSLKNTPGLLSYINDLKNFGFNKLKSDNPTKEKMSLIGKVSFLKNVDVEKGKDAETLLNAIKWS